MEAFMSKQGEFEKVSRSSTPLYGERKLLVCGYPAAAHSELLAFLKYIGLDHIPVVFATDKDIDNPIADLMALPGRSGFGDDSTLKRAIILSGLTEKEVHTVIGGYRQAGGAEQLWAVLTPISEKWPLRELLEELEAEHKAMKERKKASE